MSYRPLIAICVFTLFAAATAAAQSANPPFIDPTVVGYEAQIATGQSAVSLGVKPTASADRKYVSTGIQATDSGPGTFTPFQISAPPGGPAVSGTPAPAPAAKPGMTSPGGRPVSVLDRVGMTFLAPLP